VFDLVYAYADCGPRPSVYERVVAIEIRRIEQLYGVRLGVDEANKKKGEWRLGDLSTVETSLALVDTRLRQAIDIDAWRSSRTGSRGPLPPAGEMFKRIFSPLEFLRGPRDLDYYPEQRWYGRAGQGQRIYLYGPTKYWGPGSTVMLEVILHELGHILDQRNPRRYHVAMGNATTLRRAINNIQENEEYPAEGRSTKILTGSGLGINWRTGVGPDEIWADLFASWANNAYGSEEFAPAWRKFIMTLMGDVATANAIEG
jgi:hypothetical protein